MKRLLSVLLSLALVLAMMPAFAEEPVPQTDAEPAPQADTEPAPQTDTDTVGQEIDKLLEELDQWLNGLSNDAQEAAGQAGEWADKKLDELGKGAEKLGQESQAAADSVLEWLEKQWKELTENAGEQADALKGEMSDAWDSLSKGAEDLFSRLNEGWESMKDGIAQFFGKFDQSGKLIVRETILEEIALVEELSAEHEVPISEELRALLDGMKAFAEDPDMELPETPADDKPLTDFLAQIGVDEATFQQLLGERVEDRLTKLGIGAESKGLRDYMEETGIAFNSAALRAQDRLERYASGALEMTEEDVSKAVEILKDWAKQAGVDEAKLTEMILKNLETAPAEVE